MTDSLSKHTRVRGILARVEEELRSYEGPRLSNITYVAQGLEGIVFRAESSECGPLAIRVPLQRWVSNDNDPAQDSRALLRQEAAFARYLEGFGFPVVDVIAVHIGERADFLLASFVTTDAKPIGAHQLGEIAAQLHAVPPPDMGLVAQEGVDLPHLLARRISNRVRVVERFTELSLSLPPVEDIAALLAPFTKERHILHMDMRPENVLVSRGRITALIDWSNALYGPPELEFARVLEYMDGDLSFFEGYGTAHPFGRISDPARLLFGIDTAVMLAVVGLSEQPNIKFARHKVERLRVLFEDLEQSLDGKT